MIGNENTYFCALAERFKKSTTQRPEIHLHLWLGPLGLHLYLGGWGTLTGHGHWTSDWRGAA